MTIRVHLADDHTMFREGLEAILSSRGDIEVVGRSSVGGEDALALIEENKPDVIVAEIDEDLNTAREVLFRIRSASSDSKIVILTMFNNLHYVQALSKMSIDAYIHKTSSSEELIATIDALGQAGAKDNVVVSMPRGSLERMGAEPVKALSEREMEILILTARGLSNCRIATELHLAEATVKRHMANIFQKMAVHSRSEAVRMALMEQWIGLHEIICPANTNARRTAPSRLTAPLFTGVRRR
jgi:DNA-binding NarL/FixJ family response regulator